MMANIITLLLSVLVLVAAFPTLTFAQSPRQGPPGSLFTVSASGFRSYELVVSIRMGRVELIGSRTINTDSAGAFTAEDLQVPGLDPGTYALVVTVGSGQLRTTTSSTFEITGPRRVASSETPASGLAPIIDADNLVRVFFFRNSSKDWIFYDPRPAFASFNTLEELRGGEVYWIKVKRLQEPTLNGTTTRVSCANAGTTSENCWNLVVW